MGVRCSLMTPLAPGLLDASDLLSYQIATDFCLLSHSLLLSH